MKRLVLLAILAIAVLGAGEPAWAQQGGQQRNQGQQGQGQQGAANSLPPALQAAVLSGNSAAVSQAINTLSGGNPAQAATLAAATIAAAEQMLATNPQNAVAIAAAAVTVVNSVPVMNSSPASTENVLVTAARIFANPVAQAAVPAATADLASKTLTAAAATNNPSLVGAVAVAAVAVAEKLLATNPTAAVTLAGQAVQAVNGNVALGGVSEQVLTGAARVVVSPMAAGVSPTLLANVGNAIQLAGGAAANANVNINGADKGPVKEESKFLSGSAN